jgi:CBS domain-containing protein
LATLVRLNVGALVVLKDSKPVGIFSERDLLKWTNQWGGVDLSRAVDHFMSSTIVYVTPSYRIEECLAIMSNRHIRHLPVIDEKGMVVALLSMRHIMEALIDDKQFLINELMRYVGAESPPPLTKSRPIVLEWNVET